MACKDLVEAAPAHVEVGDGGIAAAGGVGLGPLGDAGEGAVWDEVAVRVDVGDEVVERLARVWEGPGRCQVLGVGAGEGDEAAACWEAEGAMGRSRRVSSCYS